MRQRQGDVLRTRAPPRTPATRSTSPESSAGRTTTTSGADRPRSPANRQQTVYVYSGKATVSWEFRDIHVGDCTLAPANGAFTQKVNIQVNRVPDRRRGWSYTTGGAAQGDTGPYYSDCPGERLSN